jgi:hypothetical protein
MSRIRKMATAAATFSVALGIGFVMQNGDALAARFGAEPTAPGMTDNLTNPVPRVQITVSPGAQAAVAPLSPVTGPAPAMPVVATLFPVAAPAMSVPGPAMSTPVVTASLPPSAGPAMSQAAPALSAPADVTSVGLSPDLPAAAPLGAMPAPLPVPAAFDSPATIPEPLVAQEDRCLPGMTATAQTPGLAVLTLSAPCAPSQAVLIHHEGMMFTILTDATGAAQVTVPALAVDAMFIADLGQGLGAMAQIALPEVAALDRAVVQGLAGQGLALHAFADGATFGAPGHVWRDNSPAPGDAGGFVMVLGSTAVDDAHMAEVYTFPRGGVGRVDLAVEAKVTAATCGTALSAQTLQLSPGAPAFAREVMLDLPGCDATGEFVMLPDMLMGVALAAN